MKMVHRIGFWLMLFDIMFVIVICTHPIDQGSLALGLVAAVVVIITAIGSLVLLMIN